MYACEDPSSMRFVALYHDPSRCEKRGFIDTQNAESSFGYQRRSVKCSFDSTRFVHLYGTSRDPSPTRVSESGDELTVSSISSASDASQPFSQKFCESPNFRPGAGSSEHTASYSHKSTICADEVCGSPNSMRFVPLYSKIETYEKRGLIKLLEDDFPVQCKGSFVKPFAHENSLIPPCRGPSPTKLSESCDCFAASSPYSAASKSSQSEVSKKSTLVIVNSSDSGVFNSPSFEESSFGSPGSKFPSLITGKRISILKRNRSFEALNPTVKPETENVRRPPPRDLVAILNKLTISDGTKDSSDDERTPKASCRRGRRRPKVLHKRRLFRSTSNVPHFRPFKIHRRAIGSAASSFRSPVWDDNNNNESAEDSSSAVSLRRVSHSPQLRKLKTQAVEQECSFCKSNKETEDFMRSHAFRIWEPSSGVYKLNCPVLRKYVCPRCGATGDAAHTYTYCPETIKEVGYRPRSLIAKFKRSAHDSSGRRRIQNAPPHRSSI